MFNLGEEIQQAMRDGLEVVFTPIRMANEDQTLKSIKIRVIQHREQETVSVSREVFADAIVRKQMSVESSLAAELMIARTKVLE